MARLPMRSKGDCARIAAKILNSIPQHQHKAMQTIDIFAALICGEDDATLALTPSEAGIAMGFDPAYGRSLLQRMLKAAGTQGA